MLNIEEQFLKPAENLRNLQLLEEIAKDSDISQRKLSQQLGIALGVTNACLKKMINKGLVKIKGINHKRIAYYLTPQGISEKTRLAYYFLEYTVKFYCKLKDDISVKLTALTQAGHKRVIFYGAGEALEVAFVILHESAPQLTVLAVVDDDESKQGKRMFGLEVRRPEAISELKPDAVLITSIKYKDKIFKQLNDGGNNRGIAFYSL